MKEIQSNYDRQADMARELFCRYDTAKMIRKFRLEADPEWLFLTWLGMPCRISRADAHVELWEDGWQVCRDFNTVMSLYDLLCFDEGEFVPALSGQWCTVGNFVVTGVTNTASFTKKFAARFSGRLEDLKAACVRLGGEPVPSIAGADLTCRFSVTPFFPVLFQFWEADEEFPASVLLLWDRNSDRFLRFETTFYLQGDLLYRLDRAMDRKQEVLP